ncbi:methyltransferase [Desulfopila aestuarii]|uniref:Dimerisation domain-containing protein n=1 Tax=Desulfopila aestuarii DSM 18488 TaxID=1121416 RepID=A0A1M7YGQ7_9BACT|nr:methyltransferase [Desulfopila aestuarii]SHO51708.1 Dimerisation domain-containing protein [Desulfopila aestuarii DSM 18488]
MAKVWNPGMLLSVSSGYWTGCTLQAGVRLKIFTGLAGGALPADDLAVKLDCDERATVLLLDALSAMGLLIKEGEVYRNSDAAQELLVADSPRYMGHIIMHHHHLLDGWAQLDQAVKTGEAVKKRSYGIDTERESFLMGMFNLAMAIAPAIAKEISLSDRRRLLDLGGGPGTYAIQFCLANPGLRAVILDRPTTEPFARRTAERFGVSDRIDFIGGDFTVDDISGGPYDVAWLSQILHSNTLEACEELIARTVEALEPNGMILVHDFILDNTKDGPEFPALFSLNMLLAGNGGRSYSEQEIRDMLEKAGVEDITRYQFRAPNDSSILAGRKG